MLKLKHKIQILPATQFSYYSLRSSRQPLLAIRQCRTDYGRRTFSVAAAKNWDKLLKDVQLSEAITSTIVRNRLKTFLFETVFNEINNSIWTIALSASVAKGFTALYKFVLNWKCAVTHRFWIVSAHLSSKTTLQVEVDDR